MLKSVVSTKGQITIPAAIRERLGLGVGTTLLIEERPGGLLLRKGTAGEHPVDQVFGMLRDTLPRGDARALVDELRGPRLGRRRAPPRRAGRRTSR
jgi:AbrB family looped-hinge helix DNA binding protein